MARPAKSTGINSKHMTKEEIENRKAVEDRLKGGSFQLVAPAFLTGSQKEIFNYIIKELKQAEILGNLDVYILSNAAIAIDRMEFVETLINNDINNLQNKNLMQIKEKYSKEFFRCCNELCLSPQSRAKMALQAHKNKEEKVDPLLEVLGDLNGTK